jgi:serine/threonine protein kinase
VNDQATIQTECLSADTMRSYWQGLAADHEVETIEQHLQNCSQCMAMFKRFETANEQVDILRDLLAADIKLALHHQGSPDLCYLNDGLPATHARSAQEYDEESDYYPWRSWLPPTKLIGPYRVVRTIGHGGMGAVVLAEHVRLRRQFAMKLLCVPRSFSRAQSRFRREAEAIGRLHHPSIVTASDAGQEGSLHYLVMEYVDGFDLSKLSRLIEDFSVCDVSEIGRQIALALAYAHEQGLVHRDIKPSNIMLDTEGRIKLLDFGLVQLDRWNDELSELTSVGQFLGTLDYMAPEQAERAGQVDHRADLYGLGATMFRLLCGRAPLATTPHLSPLEKLRLLAHHAPPSLRTIRNDAPEELVQIVDRLLATDPNNRPINAESIAEQLTRLAEGTNLRRLIELGQTSQSVEELPFEPTHDSEGLNENVPDTPAAQQHTIPSQPPNRWRRYGGLVALGLLPIAFVAGIILQIPVEEGMLLVESELPEGELKIVRAKDGHEQRLKVDVGPQVTKLLAGKYSLELNSPSDSISIENDTFVVSKGETVVAKVRLKRNETQEVVVDAELLPAIPTPAASAIEARFQGKNLTEWLEIYERQKDGKLPYETAQALVVLLGHSAEQSLFEEFCENLLNSQSKALRDWTDPRISQTIFERFEGLDKDEKRKLLLELVQANMVTSRHLSKIVEWIEKQFADNVGDARTWFHYIAGSYDWVTELELHYPSLLHRYDSMYLERTMYEELVAGYSSSHIGRGRYNSHEYIQRVAERVYQSRSDSFQSRVFATYILMHALYKLPTSTQANIITEYKKLLSEVPSQQRLSFVWQQDYATRKKLYNLFSMNWNVDLAHALLNLPDNTIKQTPHIYFVDLSIDLLPKSVKAYDFYHSVDALYPLRIVERFWGDGREGKPAELAFVSSLTTETQTELWEQTQALMLQLRLCEMLVYQTVYGDPKPMKSASDGVALKRYLESLEEWRDLLKKTNKEQDGVIANSDLQDKPEAIELLKSKGFTIPLDQPVNLPSYLETKYRDQ